LPAFCLGRSAWKGLREPQPRPERPAKHRALSLSVSVSLSFLLSFAERPIALERIESPGPLSSRTSHMGADQTAGEREEGDCRSPSVVAEAVSPATAVAVSLVLPDEKAPISRTVTLRPCLLCPHLFQELSRAQGPVCGLQEVQAKLLPSGGAWCRGREGFWREALPRRRRAKSQSAKAAWRAPPRAPARPWPMGSFPPPVLRRGAHGRERGEQPPLLGVSSLLSRPPKTLCNSLRQCRSPSFTLFSAVLSCFVVQSCFLLSSRCSKVPVQPFFADLRLLSSCRVVP